MSFDQSVNCLSLEAGSDLSAAQHLFVDVATDKQVDVVATKGAKAVGVLQDKPAAAGRIGSVAIGGITKVKAGAAFNAGAELISTAAGKAIVTDAVNQYIMGTALEAATADGDIVAMIINRYQRSA